MPKFSLAQIGPIARIKFAKFWSESRDMGAILCDNLRHPLYPGAAVDADRQDEAGIW